jgi:hypothetical protein
MMFLALWLAKTVMRQCRTVNKYQWKRSGARLVRYDKNGRIQ